MNTVRDNFYMEDVTSVALEVYSAAARAMRGQGVDLTMEETDDIYCAIKDKLEEFCNGEYRHHN